MDQAKSNPLYTVAICFFQETSSQCETSTEIASSLRGFYYSATGGHPVYEPFIYNGI
ncbi:hypothetical protein X975_25613, partial [Stegodyphus mimosarum]